MLLICCKCFKSRCGVCLLQDGGGLNSSDELIIRILDVQDTPPQIQGTPYVITIPENIAIVSKSLTEIIYLAFKVKP